MTEDEVIDVYQRLLWNPQNTVVTKQYTLLSLTKLSTRFQKGHELVLFVHDYKRNPIFATEAQFQINALSLQENSSDHRYIW